MFAPATERRGTLRCLWMNEPTPRTSCPSASDLSVRCEPMNPGAPVTTMCPFTRRRPPHFLFATWPVDRTGNCVPYLIGGSIDFLQQTLQSRRPRCCQHRFRASVDGDAPSTSLVGTDTQKPTTSRSAAPERSLSALRLVGAVLAEQNDEWADSGRRYMSLEAIAKTLAPPSPEATMGVAMIAA